MKSKTSLSDAFFVIYKTTETDSWQIKISEIVTPTTLTFAISALSDKPEIKKVTWDLGNGNQHKSFTNRKQNLYDHKIDCKYRKANNTTVTIQASVYTDDQVFITPALTATTVNNEIKDHYIEPEVFKCQIMKYYKTNKFTDDVAESIYKIANRLAFAPNFINYTYREEMVGDAVVRMIEALTTQKFDPRKGNPFSYFTKIAFHAFCNRIKKEKKIREALVKYQNSVYNEMMDENGLSYSQTPNTGDSEEYHFHEDT